MSDVKHFSSQDSQDVSLTETAVRHLVSCLKKQGGRGVRFSVKKTGCSGLSYVVDYMDAPLEADVVLPLAQDYMIYIDKNSYPYLKGIEVDYVKQGLNQKFVFINPNQTGQCGCGESFTVD